MAKKSTESPTPGVLSIECQLPSSTQIPQLRIQGIEEDIRLFHSGTTNSQFLNSVRQIADAEQANQVLLELDATPTGEYRSAAAIMAGAIGQYCLKTVRNNIEVFPLGENGDSFNVHRNHKVVEILRRLKWVAERKGWSSVVVQLITNELFADDVRETAPEAT